MTEHHKLAQNAYDAKDFDKKFSKESNGSVVTLTFDLQQCLPTPNLQSGVVFYKRLLWTYDLTIFDCNDNQAHCYMWAEPEGGRGGNQIASCVSKHLKSLPLTYLG